MIPPFNLSNVLPPFVGTSPADRALCSPYEVQATELVNRFATSPQRQRLLTGLLDLRDALRRLGINDGVQWIDGSFVEDVETIRGAPPADIDVVTFAERPVADARAWLRVINANLPVFDSQTGKASYGCDHYFLDLMKRPNLLVADTAYFFGLFSHQRASALWKGMLQLPLASDDAAARALL